MSPATLGLNVVGVLLAAIGALMLYAASLGMKVHDGEVALMHVQTVDVIIGVGSALGAVVYIAAAAVVSAIDAKRT